MQGASQVEGRGTQTSGPSTEEFALQDGTGQADAGTEAPQEGMGSCYHTVPFRAEIALVL